MALLLMTVSATWGRRSPYYIDVKEGLSFGIKGGVNFSNFTHYDANFKVGLLGGVFGEYRFSRVSLSADLLYSVQGTYWYHDDLNYSDRTLSF